MKDQEERNALYKLLSDGYYGTGGFFDGSYLEQHPREEADKYQKRKKLAYYLNYLQPCVSAHVTPIFKNKPNREWSGAAGEIWGQFVQSVDYIGTTLDALMKRAALGAKLFGVAFLVMDNVPQTVDTVGKMLETRVYPQAFIVEPARVKKIKRDALNRIVFFSYTEADPEDENKKNVRTFTPQGWQLADEGDKVLRQGSWNINCVPVVPLTPREFDPRESFPPSEFISIAQTCKQIFNMSSWLSDILVNQAFSIMVYPAARNTDLTIGTNNALSFDPEARHKPEFIAPPASPAEILAEQINTLQRECFRMATVVNVGGSSFAQSGESKKWDFESTNQLLSSFADNLELVEEKLAELFALWLNMKLEYSCNYPSDFSLSDIATELANAEVAKGMAFCDAFNVEVFKRVLASYLPELQPDEFDRLVREYQTELAQMKQDEDHLEKEELEDDDDTPRS